MAKSTVILKTILIFKALATLLLLLYVITSFTQTSAINFNKLTNEQGLSQASVNVLFKDREGFLWIGTDDGLNRSDGKEIRTRLHIRQTFYLLIF